MPSTRRTFLAGAAAAVGGTGIAAGDTDPSPPSLAWSRRYDAADRAAISDVVPTEGGYLLVGSAGVGATPRGWVARVDDDGRRRESGTLGDAGTRLLGATATDAGTLVVGRTNIDERPDTSRRDPYAARLGDDGVEWARTYQPALPDGGATAVTSTGSGAVLAGTADPGSGSVPWAVGVDAGGTRRWTWRGDATGAVTDAVAIPDGVVLVGSVGDPERALAVGLDPAGRQRWRWIADADDASRLAAAVPSPDGVVAVGRRGFDPGRGVGWLVSLATEGRRWERTYRRDAWNWHHDVAPLGDGYVLAGEIGDANAGERAAWLLAVGPEGDRRWERRADSGTDGLAVRALHDGAILLAGATRTDDGQRPWLARFGEGGGGIGLPTPPSIPSWTGPSAVGAVVGAAGVALYERYADRRR